MSASIVYLNVTFQEKDIAKSLGARWDAIEKKWFVPEGIRLKPFARWLDEDYESVSNSQTLDDEEKETGAGEEKEDDVLSLFELLSQVNLAIKQQLPLPVWVKAEISQVRKLGEHLSVELVEYDNKAQLLARVAAFIWQAQVKKLMSKFQQATGLVLKEGIKVLLLVKLESHAVYGLRLVISDIDPSFTLGDIQAKLNLIRETLKKQNLYHSNKALPKPYDFCRVAVISPEHAAGLGDFKQDANQLTQAGLCQFDYFTAVFQSKEASASIRFCLFEIMANTDMSYDAICLIRGGGASSDLYWLNELELAQAICHCHIPVFTGIGHERDNTILDEIAQIRFDTPSKVIAHIRESIYHNALQAHEHYQVILSTAHQSITQAEKSIEQLAGSLYPSVQSHLVQTELKIEQCKQIIEHQAQLHLQQQEQSVKVLYEQLMTLSSHQRQIMAQQLTQIYQGILNDSQYAVDKASSQIEALSKEILGISPQRTLNRGFALVRNAYNQPITRVQQAQQEPLLSIEFKDGSLTVIPNENKTL